MLLDTGFILEICFTSYTSKAKKSAKSVTKQASEQQLLV